MISTNTSCSYSKATTATAMSTIGSTASNLDVTSISKTNSQTDSSELMGMAGSIAQSVEKHFNQEKTELSCQGVTLGAQQHNS